MSDDKELLIILCIMYTFINVTVSFDLSHIYYISSVLGIAIHLYLNLMDCSDMIKSCKRKYTVKVTNSSMSGTHCPSDNPHLKSIN